MFNFPFGVSAVGWKNYITG